mgnify:CR=1 FL=1
MQTGPGAPPDMVRWIPRNAENSDCAITALQLATGLTYEAVLAAALNVVPGVLTKGMSMANLKRVAAELGFAASWKRKYDISEATGLLYVETKKEGHVVYLWEGRVIEPLSQSLWRDPADYARCEGLRIGSLLVLRGDE